MPRTKKVEEVKPVEVVEETKNPSFLLKEDYRWNFIQSAGVRFSKVDPVELNADDERLGEIRANPDLVEV